MYVQKKWQINQEKVAFAKGFPGRITAWPLAVGKTIMTVVQVENRPVGLAVFSDGTFMLIPSIDPQPADLIEAILAARNILSPFHGDAYQRLDDFIASDREMQRMARLENIMGAIRNNMPAIPELEEALKRFLTEKDSLTL